MEALLDKYLHKNDKKNRRKYRKIIRRIENGLPCISKLYAKLFNEVQVL